VSAAQAHTTVSLLLVSAAQAHTTVSLLLVSAAQAHTTVRLHVPCTPILRHARTVLAAPAVTYDGVSESMQQGERLLDAIREATHARKQARPPILRRCAAEFAATGLIFFVGNALTALLATGAIASALTWGVVVAAAVASTVNLSGAHFNPSVTIAFAAGGKHPWAETPAYILAQFAGAAAAATCLSLILGEGIGPLLPAVPSFGVEARSTSMLLLAVFGIGDTVETCGLPSRAALPLCIGLLIAALNLSTSHLGVCLNPAMGCAGRLAHALAHAGPRAFAGSASFVAAPIAGAIVGGGWYALLTGNGAGVYEEPARLHRRLRLVVS